MINDFKHIRWEEQTTFITELLNDSNELTMDHLLGGLEAEVIRVRTNRGSAVFKIWHKQSNPDVGFQYKLLKVLSDNGISVSKPYGWGYDNDSNKLIVTSYDGNVVSNIDKQTISKFSRMLFEVHETSINQLDESSVEDLILLNIFSRELRSMMILTKL